MIIRHDVPAVVPDKPRTGALGHVHVHAHGFSLFGEGVDEHYRLRRLLEELDRFELRLAERRGIRWQ